MPYADPEKKKEYSRQWWANNKAHTQAYRIRTRAKRSESHRVWRLENKEQRNADMRKWREDPQNRLSSYMRSRVSNALRGRAKSAKTLSLIGCSWDHLRAWLEFWMRPGMTWENYGEWEVDHKIPCASFDLSKEEEQRKCFNYRNLQPLWMADNRRKKDSLNYVVQ